MVRLEVGFYTYDICNLDRVHLRQAPVVTTRIIGFLLGIRRLAKMWPLRVFFQLKLDHMDGVFFRIFVANHRNWKIAIDKDPQKTPLMNLEYTTRGTKRPWYQNPDATWHPIQTQYGEKLIAMCVEPRLIIDLDRYQLDCQGLQKLLRVWANPPNKHFSKKKTILFSRPGNCTDSAEKFQRNKGWGQVAVEHQNKKPWTAWNQFIQVFDLPPTKDLCQSQQMSLRLLVYITVEMISNTIHPSNPSKKIQEKRAKMAERWG